MSMVTVHRVTASAFLLYPPLCKRILIAYCLSRGLVKALSPENSPDPTGGSNRYLRSEKVRPNM